VAVFFDKQLVYDAIGRTTWPGEARSHGVAGYVEFVQEILDGNEDLLLALVPIFISSSAVGRNDVCPCGSGKKFKKCHLNTVESIGRRVGWSMLRKVFRNWDARNKEVNKLIIDNEQ
jgi:hypothetical protein